MSLSGLEPIKEEIITPAVEVAAGRATVEQVHREYRGMELICPHCLREWSAKLMDDDIAEMLIRRDEQSLIGKQLFTKEQLQELRQGLDKSGLLATMQAGVNAFPEKLRVRFRRGCLDKANTISRWMHWVHKTHRVNGESKPPCHDPGCLDHAVAVGAIQLTLQDGYKSSPHVEVLREKDLIITPGEPPLKRRPDLVVRESNHLIQIFEIQRSVIQKDILIERTQHLQSLCPNVNWIFFRGTYNRMAPQRRWLSEMGLSYYYLFLNEDSRVVVEEGKPPGSREHKLARKSAKSDCRFDDTNESSRSFSSSETNTSLPLSVVGAAIFRQKNCPTSPEEPQLPQWNCSVGDIVEVWVSDRWLKGTVCSYTPPDIPVVRLQKPTSKGRRLVSPPIPRLIRPFQQCQQKEQSQRESQSIEQLNLF